LLSIWPSPNWPGGGPCGGKPFCPNGGLPCKFCSCAFGVSLFSGGFPCPDGFVDGGLEDGGGFEDEDEEGGELFDGGGGLLDELFDGGGLLDEEECEEEEWWLLEELEELLGLLEDEVATGLTVVVVVGLLEVFVVLVSVGFSADCVGEGSECVSSEFATSVFSSSLL